MFWSRLNGDTLWPNSLLCVIGSIYYPRGRLTRSTCHDQLLNIIINNLGRPQVSSFELFNVETYGLMHKFTDVKLPWYHVSNLIVLTRKRNSLRILQQRYLQLLLIEANSSTNMIHWHMVWLVNLFDLHVLLDVNVFEGEMAARSILISLNFIVNLVVDFINYQWMIIIITTLLNHVWTSVWIVVVYG